MALPFTCNFSLQLRTLLLHRAQKPLTQSELRDWQIPHSLAGCSENGVAERGDKRRYPGLTDARRWSVAIDDVDVRLSWHLIDSSYRIILKVRLVDCALRSRNLAASHDAGAEHCSALELGASCFRIYDQPRVQGHI